jgi:type I restriction enzyme S subunit
MRTYEKYKDSGISWIGKIPEEWEIRRIKHDCSLHGRIGWNGLRAEEFEKQSYAYLVTGQDFHSSDVNWNACYQINEWRFKEDPFIQLKNGDILITKDGTIGKIAMVRNLDKPACLNSGIFVMRQKKKQYEQRYLYWSLCSNLLKDFNSYRSTGTTILHLYQNVFENMPLVCPSLFEQEAIANYLDKKTAEIDKIIAEREKKIELLNELKSSIISRAVTKGINPHAKMKDSGIDWIGEIPEDWEVRRLKFIVNLQSGSNLTSEKIKDEGKYPVYGGNGIRGFYSDYNLDGNYVLIGRQGALCGNINYSKGKIWATEHAVVCYPIKELNYRWLGSMLKVMNLNQYSTSAAQPGLAVEKIKNIEIAYPPFKEQNEISNYITKIERKINKYSNNTRKTISLLREYKQSLISEVVTGKRKEID